MAKTALARVLGGLRPPTSGVIPTTASTCAISTWTPSIGSEDSSWTPNCRCSRARSRRTSCWGATTSLQRRAVGAAFTELEEEVDALPHGLKTRYDPPAKSSPHAYRAHSGGTGDPGAPATPYLRRILHNMHPPRARQFFGACAARKNPGRSFSSRTIEPDAACRPANHAELTHGADSAPSALPRARSASPAALTAIEQSPTLRPQSLQTSHRVNDNASQLTISTPPRGRSSRASIS